VGRARPLLCLTVFLAESSQLPTSASLVIPRAALKKDACNRTEGLLGCFEKNARDRLLPVRSAGGHDAAAPGPVQRLYCFRLGDVGNARPVSLRWHSAGHRTGAECLQGSRGAATEGVAAAQAAGRASRDARGSASSSRPSLRASSSSVPPAGLSILEPPSRTRSRVPKGSTYRLLAMESGSTCLGGPNGEGMPFKVRSKKVRTDGSSAAQEVLRRASESFWHEAHDDSRPSERPLVRSSSARAGSERIRGNVGSSVRPPHGSASFEQANRRETAGRIECGRPRSASARSC
jgi:hypothetical protein